MCIQINEKHVFRSLQKLAEFDVFQLCPEEFHPRFIAHEVQVGGSPKLHVKQSLYEINS